MSEMVADRARWGDRWWLCAVAVLAAAAGVFVFLAYWPRADDLWGASQHDRNLHYLQGLTLAMAARRGDAGAFFGQVNRMDVWGVFHALMVAGVEVFARDHRWAVLPSLMMWGATAVFAFLLGRRAVEVGGNVAGAVAGLMVLGSPAMHAFATDVMLESTGAGLTMAALWGYLRYVQERTRGAAVVLTVACGLLFFTKYNYWLLVMLAVVGAEVWRRRAGVRGWARGLGRMARWPLVYVAGALFAIGFYVMAMGTVRVAGMVLERPHRVFEVAWGAVCVQAVVWWLRGGRRVVAGWGVNRRIIVLGQAVPAAAWFLLPRKLGAFFWFLSPGNTDQAVSHYTAFYGLPFYWRALGEDYFAAGWMLVATVVLVGVGLLGVWRLRPGAGVIFMFLGIAALLTFHHPMLKNRFVHSWVAILWVGAGVGVAMVIGAVARWSSMAARAAGAAVVAGLCGVVWPAIFSGGHAQEGGVRAGSVPIFGLTDVYLSKLREGERVQFLCTDAQSFGLVWTYEERFGTARGATLDIAGFDAGHRDAEVLRRWLAGTDAEAIVLVDLTDVSPFGEHFGGLDYAPLKAMLTTDARFSVGEQWTLPQGETVTLWERR